MKEYVLVSQGIECKRVKANEEKLILQAIRSNAIYEHYMQKCMEEHELYADNRMYVYVEQPGEETVELDLALLEKMYDYGYSQGFVDHDIEHIKLRDAGYEEGYERGYSEAMGKK